MPFLSRSAAVATAGLLLLLSTAPEAQSAGEPPARRSLSPHEAGVGECSSCHTTTGWTDIRFDHESTAFSLSAAHAEAACLDCHRVQRFDDRTADCAVCHDGVHQQALGPECADCHTDDDWQPAGLFSHDATAFPLWGAHGALDCVACHADERTFQFVEPAALCIDCHEAEFGQPAVSVHLTAGPDCETCHTLDGWSGGHDPMWFEIRSGPHEVDCARCHKRLPDYPSYTCAECHEFSLQEEEHRGIDPDDARCLDCHSPGEVED